MLKHISLLAVVLTLLLCVSDAIASEPADTATHTTPRWVQSYDAGYVDKSGAYAGGSEIMHLAAHKGKLYAANGYWVDSRWGIPPQGQKQSAQVLRLDSSDGRWQVDLDLGKANGHGLEYMKGNILKSVTFTRDASGNSLSQPVNLLVMSSGARFEGGGAVSVWVREDESGEWNHTLVRHGVAGRGIRWVPRDMAVYRDKKTGVERLFLLLGNPGIISGVYDPSLPGKIRWDRHVEFPFVNQGSFKTRPLGMVEANGSLFFSVEGSVYRRSDGEQPEYTEIVNLGDDVDTDVGGIRGLTAVANPNGSSESILFLWAPGGRSRSEIKRLDPNGDGGYTLHDETSMMELMGDQLGVNVTYTLGAHNMMYPVRHPTSGETVHIIGFQGNIAGKEHLRWKASRLYAGAMYAVRTADQKYSVHEVNNAYEPGKTILVSPRSFCLSPFGDKQIFIGGHDSSNKVSDDMAWIFKAPLDVVLGIRPGETARPSPPEKPLADRLAASTVYELRIYLANPGDLPPLKKRFREHTDRLFRKHGLEPLAYWIPTDGRASRRKFVYILKHPSRYEAWKNWVRFSNDREWQAVIDRSEFRGLLAESPTHFFMTADDDTTVFSNVPEVLGGVYELRTYVAKAGKLQELHDALSEAHSLLGEHGIRTLGVWKCFDKPESEDTLFQIVHHASRAQADANWRAVVNDSRWEEFLKEPNELQQKSPASLYLRTTVFSPTQLHQRSCDDSSHPSIDDH